MENKETKNLYEKNISNKSAPSPAAPSADPEEIISENKKTYIEEKSLQYNFDFLKACKSSNQNLNSEEFKYISSDEKLKFLIETIIEKTNSTNFPAKIEENKEKNDEFMEQTEKPKTAISVFGQWKNEAEKSKWKNFESKLLKKYHKN